mgnify:CR=1 FL=1
MNLSRILFSFTLAATAGVLSLTAVPSHAQQPTAVAIDNDDIGGVVRRPERAGSRRLGDRGDHRAADEVRQDRRHRRSGPLRDPRPAAECELPIWVRGYGLVDSPKLRAKPGQQLNLTAVPAPNEAAAAHYYSGDLLVHDDEDAAGEGFRRQHRYSEEDHAG